MPKLSSEATKVLSQILPLRMTTDFYSQTYKGTIPKERKLVRL